MLHNKLHTTCSSFVQQCHKHDNYNLKWWHFFFLSFLSIFPTQVVVILNSVTLLVDNLWPWNRCGALRHFWICCCLNLYSFCLEINRQGFTDVSKSEPRVKKLKRATGTSYEFAEQFWIGKPDSLYVLYGCWDKHTHKHTHVIIKQTNHTRPQLQRNKRTSSIDHPTTLNARTIEQRLHWLIWHNYFILHDQLWLRLSSVPISGGWIDMCVFCHLVNLWLSSLNMTSLCERKQSKSKEGGTLLSIQVNTAIRCCFVSFFPPRI